ncbi:Uncharacterised protein [Halioglobus japonicus]|nr:Uncharacterised protein [Halioglobus japonicus]
MTKPLPGADSKPWYRHFWPWFLITLPACVVVAGIWTAFIASRHADDLVVDEYYKDGLAINVQLAKKQRAEELGLSARLHFNGDLVTVSLTGPVQDSGLLLQLSHPLEADRDFTVPLAQIEPGSYRGSLNAEITPNWHWTLQGLQQEDWRLDGKVQAADIDNAPPG